MLTFTIEYSVKHKQKYRETNHQTLKSKHDPQLQIIKTKHDVGLLCDTMVEAEFSVDRLHCFFTCRYRSQLNRHGIIKYFKLFLLFKR